jgi:hypothetical protein
MDVSEPITKSSRFSVKTKNLTRKDIVPLLGLFLLFIITLLMVSSFSAEREFTVGNALLPAIIPFYAAMLVIASEKSESVTLTQVLSVLGGLGFVIWWMFMGDTSIWTNDAAWALTWADPLLNLMTELLGAMSAGFIGATQT